MTVKIDKKIPMPVARRGQSKWPWHTMNPGDSFFAAGYIQSAHQKQANELQLNVASGKTAVPGSTWATRTVTENGLRGVRVWRLT